jgi:hypothetical protein
MIPKLSKDSKDWVIFHNRSDKRFSPFARLAVEH